MTDYGEPFWICPCCKVHIPLIGDRKKLKRKIDLHPLGCPVRYRPKNSVRKWLERIKRDFG